MRTTLSHLFFLFCFFVCSYVCFCCCFGYLQNELQGLQDMLAQQADYCSAMGSACCMLLWRVSRHEECIQSILSGVSQTTWYLMKYKEQYRGRRSIRHPPNTHTHIVVILKITYAKSMMTTSYKLMSKQRQSIQSGLKSWSVLLLL